MQVSHRDRAIDTCPPVRRACVEHITLSVQRRGPVERDHVISYSDAPRHYYVVSGRRANELSLGAGDCRNPLAASSRTVSFVSHSSPPNSPSRRLCE